ncbi:hypothetical protein [uncultured Oxalicibacterium sp.]|uniref:rolling circle replication-associated protein n=1 Tax=uncultured Oxalicibacterium sp. TaxID=1168540 RepID=UPI0025D9D120|nr:hypothetical protein [uncultured Oxalicibacterium sp.]
MTADYINDSDLSYVSFDPVVNVPHEEPARNGWFDAFTATKRIFADGQMEISICKGKHFNGAALTPFGVNKKSKRGESENRERNDLVAGKAAKKKVRERCKAIGADRLVTLSFRENITDRARALKYFDLFRRRLKLCMAFHYVAVMENQKRGAIHFHIAVHGRQNYHLLRSVWQRVVGKNEAGQQMAQVNVRDPHRFGFGKTGIHKLAAYLAKYCTKEMECRELDQKRYFTSRGIPEPEIVQWRLHSNDMMTAMQVAIQEAQLGNIDGCQIWCNNGLGIVWIATAPGDIGRTDCPF